MKKTKALVLLSGGLDSLVTCKILQEQAEVRVETLYIKLPFSKDKTKDIKKFCKKNKIELHILNATKPPLFQQYLKIIKKPKHQRGTALNPCIDCHIFMLKKAKQLAKKLNIPIIATGEVLGERPLSQNKKALMLVEKESGLKGKLIRPLSAKLLPETEAEKSRIIKRNKLQNIQGRQRKTQIKLARKYKLEYPSPAGGCLLCEKDYCKKLKPILNKKITYNDIKLLLIGRHFFSSQIILGRNHKENLILEKQKGIKVIPQQAGPTALIKNKKLIKKAKELIRKYSKHKIKNFEIKN